MLGRASRQIPRIKVESPGIHRGAGWEEGGSQNEDRPFHVDVCNLSLIIIVSPSFTNHNPGIVR